MSLYNRQRVISCHVMSCHVVRCPYSSLLVAIHNGWSICPCPTSCYAIQGYTWHVIMSLSCDMTCHAIYSVVCLLVATHGLESPCHVPVDAGPALAADWAQLWWPWRILRIASPHPAHRHHHHHSHSRCRPNFGVAYTIFREDTRKHLLIEKPPITNYTLQNLLRHTMYYKWL